MRKRWRQALTALGLAVGGLLLAGCDVEGTVVVESGDQFAIDLILSGDDVECPTLSDVSLVFTPQTDASGTSVCRVTGTLTASQLQQRVTLRTAGQYSVLRVALQSEGSVPTGRTDITIRFPGQVLDASGGEIRGDGVRIVDPGDLAGLDIIALNRPGPSDRVIWAAGGVAATLLVVGAVWLVRRRARATVAFPPPADADRAGPELAGPDLAGPDLAGPDLAGTDLAGPGLAGADLAGPELAGPDPADPDGEASRAASYRELFAPPSAPELFAPPSAAEPSADPPVPAGPDEDHSIWAPPEDGGRGPAG